MSPGNLSPKAHYHLLDALRGVAAIMVIGYHFSEGFATSVADMAVNHGYLAVDFFFMLSGFVISYAYDSRWRDGLTSGRFLLRRLIRLHPMVVAGVVLGVIAYCLQGCVAWDGTSKSGWMVALAALMSVCMLPIWPGAAADVRGNNEMFPINGPEWSLFFEYIGNIFYAFVMRRLSAPWLAVVTLFSGVGLALSGVFDMCGSGSLGNGWSMADYGFAGGMLRLFFAFNMGMLLRRLFRPRRVRYAFAISAVAVVVLLAFPYVGSPDAPWVNALYDSVVVLLIFPVVIYIGACGEPGSRAEERLCTLLGDLSYPVYIVQYPFMYLLYAYVWGHGLTPSQAIPAMLAVFVGAIATAWLLMRYYDRPLRRYLSRRL